MAVEHAPAARKGLYGAFQQMGAPAGTALATLAFFAVSRLPDAQFLGGDGGYRFWPGRC